MSTAIPVSNFCIKINDADEYSDLFLMILFFQVFDTELFKGLREKYGNVFHKFMFTKLVPVAGDMTQHNLGIEEEIADVLINEVDIIVSSAANTTFDERFLCVSL